MDELDRVRVSRPCPLAQDPVGPGGGHCAHCRETVVDLSRMPRSEAMALVRAGARCVRMELGADGRVKTLVRAAAVATSLAACAVQPGVAVPVAASTDSSPDTLFRVPDDSGAPVAGAHAYEPDLLSKGPRAEPSRGPAVSDERAKGKVRRAASDRAHATRDKAFGAKEVEIIDRTEKSEIISDINNIETLKVIGYIE